MTPPPRLRRLPGLLPQGPHHQSERVRPAVGGAGGEDHRGVHRLLAHRPRAVQESWCSPPTWPTRSPPASSPLPGQYSGLDTLKAIGLRPAPRLPAPRELRPPLHPAHRHRLLGPLAHDADRWICDFVFTPLVARGRTTTGGGSRQGEVGLVGDPVDGFMSDVPGCRWADPTRRQPDPRRSASDRWCSHRGWAPWGTARFPRSGSMSSGQTQRPTRNRKSVWRRPVDSGSGPERSSSLRRTSSQRNVCGYPRIRAVCKNRAPQSFCVTCYRPDSEVVTWR